MGQSGNILARRFAPPPPLSAALWMVGSAVFFSGLSGVIRHLGQEMHPFEVAFFRNLFGLAFMLPWLWRAGRAGLETRRLALYGVRAFLGLISMLCWFTALALLPIAQVVALSFTAPLFATMAAALFLGETVRARRWTATLAGLVGVGVILWPQVEGAGGASLSPGAILALLSTAISVAITLIVKRLTRTEPANAIVTYMVLLMTPMSLVPAAFVWTWPPLDTWLWLVALGGLGSLGHVCYVRSFALADASAVMPYDYTRLLFAALIGWIAFGELPTIYTWIGAAVIVASAIYIARREALFNQSAATSAAAGAGEAGLAAPTEAGPARPRRPGG
jgi:drug/metabolite transporter (DMT)-like permease